MTLPSKLNYVKRGVLAIKFDETSFFATVLGFNQDWVRIINTVMNILAKNVQT